MPYSSSVSPFVRIPNTTIWNPADAMSLPETREYTAAYHLGIFWIFIPGMNTAAGANAMVILWSPYVSIDGSSCTGHLAPSHTKVSPLSTTALSFSTLRAGLPGGRTLMRNARNPLYPERYVQHAACHSPWHCRSGVSAHVQRSLRRLVGHWAPDGPRHPPIRRYAQPFKKLLPTAHSLCAVFRQSLRPIHPADSAAIFIPVRSRALQSPSPCSPAAIIFSPVLSSYLVAPACHQSQCSRAHHGGCRKVHIWHRHGIAIYCDFQPVILAGAALTAPIYCQDDNPPCKRHTLLPASLSRRSSKRG